MFSIALWESKLNYLRGQLEIIEDIDTSRFELSQRMTYNDLLKKTEQKVKDYEELIEELKRCALK